MAATGLGSLVLLVSRRVTGGGCAPGRGAPSPPSPRKLSHWGGAPPPHTLTRARALPPLTPPRPHLFQAALLTLALRWVRAWFARLDADAAILTAAVTLEDPTSAARVPAPSLWGEASKALSVIIPAYNEEVRLPRALDEAFRCV